MPKKKYGDFNKPVWLDDKVKVSSDVETNAKRFLDLFIEMIRTEQKKLN